VAALRVTVTGATGLLGPRLVGALRERGEEVTVLTRDPAAALARLGDVRAIEWKLTGEPAPTEALAGRDAVIHLAGEPVAQRWTTGAKRAIRESRVIGTGNLVEGLRLSDPRPSILISSSATGYYGPHGEEPIDEEAPAGRDFLAQVCVDWEASACRAQELGMRVVPVRTGVVLDGAGGALGKMLPPFRLGVGGPVAGGRQYMSWIHTDDVIGLMLAALDGEDWSAAINATAPEPVTNADFSHALGRALDRPSRLPVPGLVLRARYGEMAQIITTGARVVPARPLMLGYEFRHPHLDEALRSAIAPA